MRKIEQNAWNIPHDGEWYWINGDDDMLSGNTLEMVLIDEPAAPVYTQGDVEGLLAKVNEVASMEIGRLRKKNRSLAMRDLIRRLDRQRERDRRLDEAFHSGVQWMRFLGRNMGDEQYMPLQEGIEMGKPKIDRRLRIDGKEVRIRANSEEEYVLKASMALGCTAAKAPEAPQKHEFRAYAQYWFDTFSRSNTAQATAITYKRQLTRYLYPAFEGRNVEDITTADAQKLFNGMGGAKATKMKCRNVLNMIFNLAVEESIIARNPLASRRLRITGGASKPTEPYTVEQMHFLIANIEKLKKPMDRMFLALQALHPLRPEETLGLRWMDIDLDALKIHVRHSVTHPDRNQPVFKATKTEESERFLDLAPQVVRYLEVGAPEEFVLGGKAPLSYSMMQRMCERIQKEIGFDEKITPRRFRTTVLTDLYDATKDVKQVQNAAGHTTAAMTFKHYVKGRGETQNTATPVASAYGLA